MNDIYLGSFLPPQFVDSVPSFRKIYDLAVGAPDLSILGKLFFNFILYTLIGFLIPMIIFLFLKN